MVDDAGSFNYTIDQRHVFYPGPIPPGTHEVVVTGDRHRLTTAFEVHPPPSGAPSRRSLPAHFLGGTRGPGSRASPRAPPAHFPARYCFRMLGRGGHPMRAVRQTDPFTVLGLPARAGLSDDEVRAAWRRIAAASHPDRTDGGDAARFAAAAAAYTALRTNFGRAEALADLGHPAGSGGRRADPGRWPKAPGWARRRWRPAADGARQRGRPAAGLLAARWWARVRRGRPARLALRIAAAAAVSTGVALIAGARPATPALITGVLTWLVLTARRDLAPPG